jgi:hypothetical protein
MSRLLAHNIGVATCILRSFLCHPASGVFYFTIDQQEVKFCCYQVIVGKSDCALSGKELDHTIAFATTGFKLPVGLVGIHTIKVVTSKNILQPLLPKITAVGIKWQRRTEADDGDWGPLVQHYCVTR